MQGAVLILLLPICCGMVPPAGPTPGPPPGCSYDGKHYSPGEVMHSSTEGDCVRTLSCTETGPIAGDSRGCFMGHKRAEESDEPVPSSPVEVEENIESAVNSTSQKRAEELNKPEPDTAAHNKPEERSELDNYNEIVRALNFNDDARALDYDEDDHP